MEMDMMMLLLEEVWRLMPLPSFPLAVFPATVLPTEKERRMPVLLVPVAITFRIVEVETVVNLIPFWLFELFALLPSIERSAMVMKETLVASMMFMRELTPFASLMTVPFPEPMSMVPVAMLIWALTE